MGDGFLARGGRRVTCKQAHDPRALVLGIGRIRPIVEPVGHHLAAKLVVAVEGGLGGDGEDDDGAVPRLFLGQRLGKHQGLGVERGQHVDVFVILGQQEDKLGEHLVVGLGGQNAEEHQRRIERTAVVETAEEVGQGAVGRVRAVEGEAAEPVEQPVEGVGHGRGKGDVVAIGVAVKEDVEPRRHHDGKADERYLDRPLAMCEASAHREVEKHRYDE